MEVMMKYLTLPKDINISFLSSDEAHFKTIHPKKRTSIFQKRWEPKFISNLVCPREGKALFNGPGRSSSSLAIAMSVLSPGQLLAVERFAIDIHSKSEQKLLDKLSSVNKNIHTAMLLVEYFHKLLDKKNIKSFRKSLQTWYLVVRESKLKDFLQLSKTIRKYRKNIEACFTSGVTTVVSEGLNNKIKGLSQAKSVSCVTSLDSFHSL